MCLDSDLGLQNERHPKNSMYFGLTDTILYTLLDSSRKKMLLLAWIHFTDNTVLVFLKSSPMHYYLRPDVVVMSSSLLQCSLHHRYVPVHALPFFLLTSPLKAGGNDHSFFMLDFFYYTSSVISSDMLKPH